MTFLKESYGRFIPINVCRLSEAEVAFCLLQYALGTQNTDCGGEQLSWMARSPKPTTLIGTPSGAHTRSIFVYSS